MAKKYQIDTPAQIGGLLEALAGASVTGSVTISDKLTVTNGISGALILGTQASLTTHAVRADRSITTAANSGLTGGGNLTADRALAVSFGGNGTATTVARSDHNHDSTYMKLSGGWISGTLDLGPSATFNINIIGQTGSWARGITYKDTTGATAHAGIGLFGSAEVPGKIYLGFGSSAWDHTTAKGMFIFPSGNTGINKAPAFAFDVNGDINADNLREGNTLISTKYAAQTTSISAGTGLTGGGTLAANRTLSVSFGGNGSATTASRSDHHHDTAYLGISSKAADSDKFAGLATTAFMRADGNTATTGSVQVGTTLTVNSTATIAGKLTLTAGVAGALILDTQATAVTHAVRADRSIAAGNGLSGGGDLTTNRSLSVSFGGNGTATTVSRSDHSHDYQQHKLTNGEFPIATQNETGDWNNYNQTGFMMGLNLSNTIPGSSWRYVLGMKHNDQYGLQIMNDFGGTNMGFRTKHGVDGWKGWNVLWHSGNMVIGGQYRIPFAASGTSLTNDANFTYTSGKLSAPYLAVTGTTLTVGAFYAGTTNPTGATRLNYAGNLHATALFEGGTALANKYVPKGGTAITDADSLRVEGNYNVASTWIGSIHSGQNGLNQGYLQHYQWQPDSNPNYALQVHTNLNVGFDAAGKRHYRLYYEGTWTPWREIMTSEGGVITKTLELSKAGTQLKISGGNRPAGLFASADNLFLTDWDSVSKGIRINTLTGVIDANNGTTGWVPIITGFGGQTIGAQNAGSPLIPLVLANQHGAIREFANSDGVTYHQINQSKQTFTGWNGTRLAEINLDTDVVRYAGIVQPILRNQSGSLEMWHGGTFIPVVSGGSGKGRTAIVIAASNSSATAKAGADYVCTGVNDHVIINQAIRDIEKTHPSSGGVVFLAAGNYYIGDSIQIGGIYAPVGELRGSKVVFMGSGESTNISKTNPAGAFPIIQLGSDSESSVSVVIKDMKLTGGTYPYAAMIKGESTFNYDGQSSIIDNVTFIDSASTAIDFFEFVTELRVTNCIFHNVGTASSYALYFGDSIERGWVDKCTFRNGSKGAYFEGTEVMVTNCVFDKVVDTAIYMDGRGRLIQGNTIVGGTQTSTAISCNYNTSGIQISHNIIDFSSGGTEMPVELYHLQNAIFSNNTIRGRGNTGYEGTNLVEITGCQALLVEANMLTHPVRGGRYFYVYSSTNVTITNNRVIARTIPSPVPVGIILIHSTSGDTAFTYNDCKGHGATQTIIDSSASSYVANNRV